LKLSQWDLDPYRQRFDRSVEQTLRTDPLLVQLAVCPLAELCRLVEMPSPAWLTRGRKTNRVAVSASVPPMSLPATACGSTGSRSSVLMPPSVVLFGRSTGNVVNIRSCRRSQRVIATLHDLRLGEGMGWWPDGADGVVAGGGR
jgi:hypothetical protein